MEHLLPSIGQRYSSMFRTFMDGFPAPATYPGYFLWLAQEKVSEFMIVKVVQKLVHVGVPSFGLVAGPARRLVFTPHLRAPQIAASTHPMT